MARGWKIIICLVALLGLYLIADQPQAEARFGSRYASSAGWRPGKVLLRIRHANADRRSARRSGRQEARASRHGSCGTSAPSSCPSCPVQSTTTTTTVVKDCPACPNGVCPKP